MAKRPPEERSTKTDSAPRQVVPTGMLVLLLLAFGGSLALKAWEERRFSDNTILVQQLREAEALAGHVRAELVSARARMEGLLLTGASLEAVRRGVPFDAVSERAPPDGQWAVLHDPDGVRVFAQDRGGKWISGVRSSDDILRPAEGGRRLYLETGAAASPSPRFADIEQSRAAIACAQVADSGVAVCASRPAPLFTLDDANRVLIYVLLLAAPLLAVFGLVRLINRQREDALIAAEAGPALARAQLLAGLGAFEVSGLIGMWRWEPRTQLITIGVEAAQLIGASRSGEMSLDEFAAVAAEDDRRRIHAALEHADPMRQISVGFQGAGQTIGKYFDLIGGAADGAFTGAILNVTDRILAQQRSRRAEVLARTALDAHPGPFALWDSRRRLTHWNAAFPRIFNLDPSVMHAGASYDFVMAEATKFVRIERPLGDDANGREMLLLSDQWMRVVDRRTSNEGLITVGLDITDLKRQEASLSRSERRLRAMVNELERTRGQAQEMAENFAEQKAAAIAALSAKTAFLNNMSHELRTPLNAINGFSEIMTQELYGPLGDERYQEYASTILESGQHLLDVINDILDMAKIEAGKMEITPRPIDPSDAVDSAVRMIRRRAADKQVSLIFDPDDDLPEIHGDHRAIKQMTLNLLANAIKFTEAGGEVRVDVCCEGEWLVIRVADSGVGIPSEDLPRLGRPFEQANSGNQRPNGGTGLGLALTKSFAEMHGGHLTLESQIGVGTTVTIHLPLPAEHAASESGKAQKKVRA